MLKFFNLLKLFKKEKKPPERVLDKTTSEEASDMAESKVEASEATNPVPDETLSETVDTGGDEQGKDANRVPETVSETEAGEVIEQPDVLADETLSEAVDTSGDVQGEDANRVPETASETEAGEVIEQPDVLADKALSEAVDTSGDVQGEDANRVPETASETEAGEVTEQPDVLAEINQNLDALRQLFQDQIANNQNQIKMFDAIYREMSDYKENFLLESLHKPVIHNLIKLYDSFTTLESQFDGILKPFNGTDEIRLQDFSEALLQFQKNLENARVELKEVLYRIDVVPYEEHPEMLNRKLHRTLATKPADTPEQHQRVAEIHRTGFYWRDKVFRLEEVTIFRYTPLTVEEGEKLKEGDKTDG